MSTQIQKSGYLIIQDESINLPLRTTLDFQGAGAYAQDIGGKTIVFVPSIANLQDWVPNNFYPNGTYVVAKYEDEYRVWRAITSFTSGAGVFPAGNTIATDTNGYVGEWQEVSPLRGNLSNVSFNSQLAFQASVTPPIITGNTNDYSPANLFTTNFLRLSASGNFNLTGLLAPSPPVNQAIFIVNIGTNNIALKDSSVLSLSSNRFLLGTDKTLQPNEGIMVIYDNVSLRWRSQALNI